MSDQINSTQNFDVFRAVYRGGLSLWLNRRSLLPMTAIPTIVTFLTLMVMRGFLPDDVSLFWVALLQLPADLVTGIFCALIIFIIMKAPRKADKDKPVLFSLNLTERKDLLVTAAMTQTIFGFFAGGLYAVAYMVMEPIQKAMDAGQTDVVTWDKMAILAAAVLIGFYSIRFLLLPILVIGEYDIREFFARNKNMGFSTPIFLVKFATALSSGFLLMLILSVFTAGADGEMSSLPPIQMAIIDLVTSFFSVIVAAWGASALAIGVRQMTEGSDIS